MSFVHDNELYSFHVFHGFGFWTGISFRSNNTFSKSALNIQINSYSEQTENRHLEFDLQPYTSPRHKKCCRIRHFE